MTVRPGPWAVRAAIALAVLSLVSAVWPTIIGLLLAAAIAIVVAGWLDFRQLRRALAKMQCRIDSPTSVGRDVPFIVKLHVSGSLAAGWWAEVRLGLPSAAAPNLLVRSVLLPAEPQTAEITTAIQIPTRGLHEFGPVWIRVAGPLGFLDGQAAIACRASVQVLPEVLATQAKLSQRFAWERRLVDKQVRARQQGVGTEFESLSEFREGDDPRRVDWRATARLQRLVVRRFQVERHRDVMLLVDCGRLMGSDAGAGSKLDCAVDAGLMLARVVLQGGDRCGAATFSDTVHSYLPPQAGVRSLRTVVSSLYAAAPSWRETDFGPMFATLQTKSSKRYFVILLSDLPDVDTSGQYRTALSSLAARHLVLFVALL